jgi:very-short-patch-repair endonuclease
LHLLFEPLQFRGNPAFGDKRIECSFRLNRMAKEKHRTASRPVWEALKNPIKHMRREPTPAERTLWRALRDRQLAGLKFRRQHPIGTSVVDFYCAEVMLAVEIDGAIHDQQQEQDQAREDVLRMRGVTVIRFRNEEVMHSLPGVLDRIAVQAAALRPPSPRSGEGDRG